MKTETRPLMNAAYHLLLVLALRAGIIFMVELMTYCGAYANDLTKPGLPMKSLVYCSEASPTGFDPNRYIAVSDNAVGQRSLTGCLNTSLKIPTKSNLVSPNGGTFPLTAGLYFLSPARCEVPCHAVVQTHARFQRRRCGLYLRTDAYPDFAVWQGDSA